MTENFDVLPPSDLSELRSKGHDFGAHPWLSPNPGIDEFGDCLRTCHEAFRSRYGYLPSTLRNHYVVAPGWIDTPRMLHVIGVRMDLNPYPARDVQCGFLTGSALPVDFMDKTGVLLDFYQQCTLYSRRCYDYGQM